jgi:hypothetical protein
MPDLVRFGRPSLDELSPAEQLWEVTRQEIVLDGITITEEELTRCALDHLHALALDMSEGIDPEEGVQNA